jgi:hypothetical protein
MTFNFLSFFSNPYKFQDIFIKSLYPEFLATLILFLILFLLAIYIYFSLSWYTIAKKLRYKKPWLAWIPFANIAMWLQLGGFHWALVFLLLVPFIGGLVVSILFIISSWRVFERLNYPGWLSLSVLLGIFMPGLGIIAYGIVIGFVAWKKNS